MIENIKLKFGRAKNLPAELLTTTPITVFVGPNNSGKSKILSEIQQFCSSGVSNANNLIVDQINFTPIQEELLDSKIGGVTLKPSPYEALQPGHTIVGKRGERHQVQVEELKRTLRTPNANPSITCQWFLNYNTLILNGHNRINLVNPQPTGDLQEPALSSFQVLFRNDDKRKEVRRIVYDAFGQYLVIDPTNPGNLRLRLSSIPPADDMEERGLHESAINFHAQALSIDQASDGVKAFTGMITEMIAGDPSVLLVDEPEAFLHPSLSFKLGKEVSEIMSSSEKRLFASTHSPDFVMGCIQSGAPVNIVRLTYQGGIPTARILPSNDILKLMRNPLLRSTGVLSGLFYESVVVTEADADRAFYQEINDRLLKFSEGRGIPNCLFLNAQNKQTIKTIIKPLRQLGIPVAGIVDIDVLKEGGSVWSSFLDSGFVPDVEIESLAVLRSSLKRKFDDPEKDMKKNGGINLLQEDDREALQNLFSKLSEYGLFVVQNGELESWLKDMNVAGHGPSWLIEIFEKMGEDPTSSDYVKPTEGDVWGFIDNVSTWFLNARRHGIPK